jgi:uncharacterized membrane protein
MSYTGRLWAIGYDNEQGADTLRAEVAALGFAGGEIGRDLMLLDLAVAVRHADGTFSLERKPFPRVSNILNDSTVGFLAGLVLALPICSSTAAAILGAGGSAEGDARIDDDFVCEVQAMMKPGTSVLFILDEGGDIEAIQRTLHGLGGKVLKTNVDVERAKLIQVTLAAEEKS